MPARGSSSPSSRNGRWSPGTRGGRILSLYDPKRVGVSLTLQVLLDVLPGQGVPRAPDRKAPAWTRGAFHFLARYWGDDESDTPRLGINETILEWAKSDPDSLRRAARALVTSPKPEATADPLARRLLGQIRHLDGSNWSYSKTVLRGSLASIPEAVEILIKRPEELRRVLLRRGYTDVETIGGYLDR